MTEMPTTSDELEIWHHVVYYTFWPVLAVIAILVLAPFPLWWYDYIPFSFALAIPWLGVFVASAYFGLLGGYVMPTETYKKVRRGEWDDDD